VTHTDALTSPADVDLTGRVALITGAAGALGQRFAHTLADHGAAVAVADIRAEQLRAVHDELATRYQARSVATLLDLMATDSFADVVTGIEAELGPIDILINNAGINDANRPQRLALDTISRVIATNLEGPFALTCEVAKRLIDRRQSGRIVNISSIAAFSYSHNTASPVYSITKAAVARMTEVLAIEWAKYDINVNAIAPGVFMSEMTAGMIERIGDPSKTFPRTRIGRPDQLDSTLLYLLSPASECVTGTVIKVDDGQKPR
jgi:NAD(P)-dependent dehydrogenase (short-subunit alcohol dehydrogenase family)